MEQEKVRISYEALWKSIIRPPREEYEEESLGEKYFIFYGKSYHRINYQLMSKRGFLMKCSFIQLDFKDRASFEMPVVIYLHGNSSSRVEGMKVVPELLKYGINVFIFDFPGCGQSQGDYISLGYHEKDDVSIIINFVEKLPGVSKIGLWGRSMGAATTIMTAGNDKRIKAICVDSPFAEFRDLAKNLCKKHFYVPNFIFKSAFYLVKKTIKKINQTDLDDLNPINFVANINIPCFFIHAKEDELIPIEHSVHLFDNYNGKKYFDVVEGGHNTQRKKHIIDKICKYFSKYLKDNCAKSSPFDNRYNYSSDNSNKFNDLVCKSCAISNFEVGIGYMNPSQNNFICTGESIKA